MCRESGTHGSEGGGLVAIRVRLPDYAKKLLCELCLSSRRPIIRIGHNEALLQLLDTLTKAMKINPSTAAGQGIEVLTHLSTPRRRPRNKYSEQIEAARCYISEHAEQRIDYEALGLKLGMSDPVFYREFREIAKTSIGQYHIMVRMSKAKELLSETNLSIEEIAHQVGYDNVNLLLRLFEARTGMSPSEYRKTASASSIGCGAAEGVGGTAMALK